MAGKGSENNNLGYNLVQKEQALAGKVPWWRQYDWGSIIWNVVNISMFAGRAHVCEGSYWELWGAVGDGGAEKSSKHWINPSFSQIKS